MANFSEHPPHGGKTADGPYLALRIDHAFAPGEHASTHETIAELLTRDCFRPLQHVVLETVHGKRARHLDLSTDAIVECLRDPTCDALHVDNGRQATLTAIARVVTGRNRELFSTYIAPQASGLLLPHDPDLLSARLDAFRELAVILRAVAGCVSLEWNFELGDDLRGGHSPPPLVRALVYPGMSEKRAREREAYQQVFQTLDREIPGPERGLFLSREHLHALSAKQIQQTSAFADVSSLADDLLYVQLTDDPHDALSDDYDQLLERARSALKPILMDVSDVHVE